MASSMKTSLVLARELGSKLTLRFAAAATPLALTASSDTNGAPTISIGAGSTGGQNMFIRILEVASIGTDALGLAQTSYGPHKIQVAMELSATAGVPFNTGATCLRAYVEILRTATAVELWLETTGTPPSVTTFNTAAKLALSVDDLYNPTTSST